MVAICSHFQWSGILILSSFENGSVFKHSKTEHVQNLSTYCIFLVIWRDGQFSNLKKWTVFDSEQVRGKYHPSFVLASLSAPWHRMAIRPAASMVVEVSRVCGRVGLHGGMTSYLGRACVRLHGWMTSCSCCAWCCGRRYFSIHCSMFYPFQIWLFIISCSTFKAQK